jgi:hypothetical protein
LSLRPFGLFKFIHCDIKTDGYWAYLCHNLEVTSSDNSWYVESGCSKQMKGDKDRFLPLRKEIYGLVSIKNDDSAKIIGKGIVRIGNKNTKA